MAKIARTILSKNWAIVHKEDHSLLQYIGSLSANVAKKDSFVQKDLKNVITKYSAILRMYNVITPTD